VLKTSITAVILKLYLSCKDIIVRLLN